MPSTVHVVTLFSRRIKYELINILFPTITVADVSLSNFRVESLLSLPAHKAHPVGSVEAQVKEAATVQFCQPPPAYLHILLEALNL